MKLDEEIYLYTIAIFPHIFDFSFFLFPFVLLTMERKEMQLNPLYVWNKYRVYCIHKWVQGCAVSVQCIATLELM